jgi:phosphoribosyl-ATP pyrophosphohydrolase/phosphoribosyl-AMP cyclohydrolase
MNPWDQLTLGDDGLVVAVVQHADTDQVLMVGYMNEQALAATLDTKRVTFWSRSRQTLWEKGATSGNTLHFEELRFDCDADALLVRARPAGPTCHTGTMSCFFRPQGDDGPPPSGDRTLARVFGVIRERQAGRGATHADGKSYVRSLLDKGVPALQAKIREEAEELCAALEHESHGRVASEAADLFFHAMVGLAHCGVDLRDVAAVFETRFGVSGVDEKASRRGS